MSSELVEFSPPKGVVPEDIHSGDTFDLVSTFRLKEDGQVCLIQMGDTKMEGYDKDDYDHKDKGERKDYGDYVSSMHEAMSQGQEGGGY